MKMPRVAIVHGEQTKCEPRKEGVSYAELVYEPVQQLLLKTGLDYDDVETVISSSSDFLDGRTISDMAIQEAIGAVGKSASKVSNDGSFALIYAWMRLLSGEFDTCLVVAHSKCSEGHQALIENAAFDPLLMRKLGLTNLIASALQAQSLIAARKFTREQFALAAVHDLKQAHQNPNAHHGGSYSVQEIVDSPPLCDPIHPLEIAPYSDGAACLLLVTESWLKRHAWKKPVAWIEGLGYCTENHYLGDKHLTENRALYKAARQAYRSAGIKTPKNEIHCLEISSPFSYQTPLWLNELGFLEEAPLEDYLQADDSSGHVLPCLNASGGLMGAAPGFASGLIRVLETVKQIHARPSLKGLAHGINGFPGQSHCVWIFKSGEPT